MKASKLLIVGKRQLNKAYEAILSKGIIIIDSNIRYDLFDRKWDYYIT